MPRAVGLNLMVSVSVEFTAITRLVVVGDVEYVVPIVRGLEEIVNETSGPFEVTVIVFEIELPTRVVPKSIAVVESWIAFVVEAAVVAVNEPVIPIEE